jgi:hypothetical protein
MSAMEDFQEKIKNQWALLTAELRKRLFGANNENLDLLVDSFYKLEPQQRNGVIIGGVVGLVVIVVGFLGLYFAQVNSLNRELNRRFDALYEIRDLRAEYQREDRRFQALVDAISGGAASMRIKPFFEKIANEQGVQLEGLSEMKAPLPAENALGERFQEVKVEMRLNNISIPKLLNFIVEVEKGGGFVRIQDLQIRARYGTKLFFDAQIKARALAAAG